MTKAIALIPARGGSKRIPHKNLASIGGKSLIDRTIQTARKAKWVGRVIVSTDDPLIGAAALKSGAEVPFLRPKPLASDRSPTVRAVLHAIGHLRGQGHPPKTVLVVLQPTSPFRSSDDIDRALALFHAREAGSVVSVTGFEEPIAWAFKAARGGRLAACFRNT